MSIHSTIKQQIKVALLAHEQTKLDVMRSLSAAFTNELIAKGRSTGDELKDDEALSVIRRLVKQRKESIEQFTKGARPELASQEKAELEVLETLLPQQMSSEEIKKIAVRKKEEMKVIDKSKSGILVGAVMKEVAGRSDGGTVKAIVESLF